MQVGFSSARDQGPAVSAVHDLLGDRAWFPYRLNFERGEVILTRTNAEALSAQPFLDHRWVRTASAAQTVPIEALAQAPEIERAPGFIWHTAFCCSTVIADCLDFPDRSLSLKEPISLVHMAAARRQEDPRATDAAVAGLIRLYGRGFSPGARVLVKPSNDANTLIDATLDASGPILFLHGSLRRFLLSVAKGGEDRRRFVRGVLSDRAAAAGARFGPYDVAHLTDMQAAAVLWRVQMGEFAAAARKVGPGRARFLDCDDFLADPARSLGQLDVFFGLGLGAERIAAIVEGPKLRRHAKIPGADFDPRRENDDLEHARRLLGGDLESLEAWSAQVA
jgi:hypothetical protein